MTRILHDDTVLAEGLTALAVLDPVMGALIAVRAPYMRKRDPGFASLVFIILGQQVSTASADAAFAKVCARFDPLTPQAIAAEDDEALKSCGVSGPKIRAIRALSAALLTGDLQLDALAALEADAARAALTAVKGIGPWTADIYLLFCLGHADAFAAGDLAVQEAARLIYNLPSRPTTPEMVAFAERWRPWRGVASKVLWAHYLDVKGKKGMSLAE